MAFEGGGTQNTAFLAFFYLALSFIIVGSGFMKASISVIVGTLYEQGDKRRDPAFTIFYMGINLGAALGSLLCGFMGEFFKKFGCSFLAHARDPGGDLLLQLGELIEL